MTDIAALLREPPEQTPPEPDIEVRQPCRIWILANGEPPPKENMVVIPTRHPYIHLAMEKGTDDEQTKRSGSGHFADSETGTSFPADLRPGEPTRYH